MQHTHFSYGVSRLVSNRFISVERSHRRDERNVRYHALAHLSWDKNGTAAVSCLGLFIAVVAELCITPLKALASRARACVGDICQQIMLSSTRLLVAAPGLRFPSQAELSSRPSYQAQMPPYDEPRGGSNSL